MSHSLKKSIDNLEDLLDISTFSDDEIISITMRLSDLTMKFSNKIRENNEKPSSNTRERFGFYPIGTSQSEIRSYKKAQDLMASFWIPSEVTYIDDADTFAKLSPNEQEILSKVMAIFSISDGIVQEGIETKLRLVAPTEEDVMFYNVQNLNEQVHAQTYGDMIEKVLKDPEEIHRILTMTRDIKALKGVTDYITKFTQTLDTGRLYIMSAITERVIFSSLFAVIFWFRTYRKDSVKDVVFANELIMRDENSHALQSCDKYNELPPCDSELVNKKLTDEQVYEIMDEAMTVLDDLAVELFSKVDLIELSVEDFKKHHRNVANDLLQVLNHPIRYENVKSPNFIKLNDFNPKTNFYEGTVGAYSRGDSVIEEVDGRENADMDLF